MEIFKKRLNITIDQKKLVGKLEETKTPPNDAEMAVEENSGKIANVVSYKFIL